MRHVKEEYHDVVPLKKIYKNNKPFPHIVLDNFIDEELLNNVLDEFPDLYTVENKRSFNEPKQIKFGSIGFENLSDTANQLISFLNNDILSSYKNLKSLSFSHSSATLFAKSTAPSPPFSQCFDIDAVTPFC